MLVDYHVHTLGHGECGNSLEELIPFFREASQQGLAHLGIADHTQLAPRRVVSALRQANTYFPEVELKLGLELDLSRDTEEELKLALDMPELDFVIGSVHYIGDWLFNNPALQEEFKRRDLSTVYEQYYNRLLYACGTRLVDVVGHFDLIKLFNPGIPPEGIMHYAEPVLKAIKDADLCVEINTSGLYQPVAEMYPSEEILRRCYEYRLPVTFGSDAHTPEEVGRDISLARQLAKKVGYRQVATFAKRRRIMLFF
ncbi:MAG: histidinol-phosphatase HisJ family protein [Bacillota bacterium]|jgi:histidinol-phosphatase (PHP family)|nr:histidinol-phosphatase HisJ family protein [Candidatus Fermentithermobacillaceae bacterium]